MYIFPCVYGISETSAHLSFTCGILPHVYSRRISLRSLFKSNDVMHAFESLLRRPSSPLIFELLE